MTKIKKLNTVKFIKFLLLLHIIITLSSNETNQFFVHAWSITSSSSTTTTLKYKTNTALLNRKHYNNCCYNTCSLKMKTTTTTTEISISSPTMIFLSNQKNYDESYLLLNEDTVPISSSSSSSSDNINSGTIKSNKSIRRSRFITSSLTTVLATILGVVTAGTTSESDQCLAFEFNFWQQIQNKFNINNANAAETTATTFINPANMNTKYNKNPRYIEKTVQVNMNIDDTNNPRYRGILVRRITGDATPYKFPIKPIKLIKEWPIDVPFAKDDFSRQDPSNDGVFYSFPKLVYHIDEPAVSSLTQYYRYNIAPDSTILDICSSWVSHYPIEFPDTMKKIYATGMNPIELQLNDQLTGGYVARDLNFEPKLPYDDNMFDVVTCVVSIDYLVEPIRVLREVNRVLKPGGKVIISQSNRCFPTKAIKMWLQMNDRQHLELINGFLQYAGGYTIPAVAYDITATVPENAYRDPMFIISTTKKM